MSMAHIALQSPNPDDTLPPYIDTCPTEKKKPTGPGFPHKLALKACALVFALAGIQQNKCYPHKAIKTKTSIPNDLELSPYYAHALTAERHTYLHINPHTDIP